MTSARRYLSEHALIAATMLLSVLGFWRLYVGPDAAPDAYHHLHVLTVFAWLFLLLYQLRLVRGRRYAPHEWQDRRRSGAVDQAGDSAILYAIPGSCSAGPLE